MKDPQFPELHQHIGTELYRLRTAGKQTLEGLADDLDASHATLSLIENGRYGCLTLDYLKKLALHHGKTLGDLLPESEQRGTRLIQHNNAGDNHQLASHIHNEAGHAAKLIEHQEAEIAHLRKEAEFLRGMLRSDTRSEHATPTGVRT